MEEIRFLLGKLVSSHETMHLQNSSMEERQRIMREHIDDLWRTKEDTAIEIARMTENQRWFRGWLTDIGRRLESALERIETVEKTQDRALGYPKQINVPLALSIIGIVATWKPAALDAVVKLLLGR